MRKDFQIQTIITSHCPDEQKLVELVIATFEEALLNLGFHTGGVSLLVTSVHPCPCPIGIKGSLADQAEHLAATKAPAPAEAPKA